MHLPLEFVLFFVKVKYLKEIVDSRVVQSGKYVCEDVHREQTDHTVRNKNEGVAWEAGTVKKTLMKPITGHLQVHKIMWIALAT